MTNFLIKYNSCVNNNKILTKEETGDAPEVKTIKSKSCYLLLLLLLFFTKNGFSAYVMNEKNT